MAKTLKLRNLLIAFAISSPAFVGCAGVSYLQNEVALKDLAHQAYRCEPGVPKRNKYARHFERGWVQAYYNISKGADCCPPSAPPEQYWSTKYQNNDGQRKIAAWFTGYSCGVAAAQRDCRDKFATVPVGASCTRERATKCSPSERVDGLLDDAASLSQSERPFARQIGGVSNVGDVTSLPPTSIEQSSFQSPTFERLPELDFESTD